MHSCGISLISEISGLTALCEIQKIIQIFINMCKSKEVNSCTLLKIKIYYINYFSLKYSIHINLFMHIKEESDYVL